MQAAIGTQTHRLILSMSIAHNELFIEVFIELILNTVDDSSLFGVLYNSFVLVWEKAHDVIKSNEPWVFEFFF